MTSDDAFVRSVEGRMRMAMEGTATNALCLLDAGGKRLRARLVWWSANATADAPRDPDEPALVQAAAAIELAHLGSLVHDDIVDGAETRRGIATLHRSHGLVAATELGASLAHLANELVATLGPGARLAVRRALLATCRGQIRELATLFSPVPARRRLAIMQEKTGAFFDLAANLGALVVGAAPRSSAAVRCFARRFGVAFQIADDVLDLTGDPAELGRTNGTDLRDGVFTLPVLLGGDPALPSLLARVRTTPDADAVAGCIAAIVESGGTAAAADLARYWLERAIVALADLPASDARAELAALADASVARGLRASPGRSRAPIPARPVAAPPFEWRLLDANGAAHADLPRRLAHILDWFHRGLGGMVASRAHERRIQVRRADARRRLQGNGPWSCDAAAAIDALALAHALADARSLRDDPVRTLALVDALHCAGIALLALVPSVHEHVALARRARIVDLEPASEDSSLQFERGRRNRTAQPLQPSM